MIELFNIPKLVSIKLSTKSDNMIYVSIPNIKHDIPLTIIFRLLGYETDKEILYFIVDNSCNDE